QTTIDVANQLVDDRNRVHGVLRQRTPKPATEFSSVKCRPSRAVLQAVKIAGGMCLSTSQDIVLRHSRPPAALRRCIIAWANGASNERPSRRRPASGYLSNLHQETPCTPISAASRSRP